MNKGEFQEIIKDYGDEELLSIWRDPRSTAMMKEFIRLRNAGIIAGSGDVAKSLGKSRTAVDRFCRQSKRNLARVRRNFSARQAALAAGVMLDLSVDCLSLDIRSLNCLTGEGIKTVRDLTTKSAFELLRIPNLGHHSLAIIVKALGDFGLGISPQPPPEMFGVPKVVYPNPREISSAPRDGTLILLYAESGGQHGMAWHTARWLYGGSLADFIAHVDVEDRMGWFICSQCRNLRCGMLHNATHWMPLPPDP